MPLITAVVIIWSFYREIPSPTCGGSTGDDDGNTNTGGGADVSTSSVERRRMEFERKIRGENKVAVIVTLADVVHSWRLSTAAATRCVILKRVAVLPVEGNGKDSSAFSTTTKVCWRWE